MGWELVNKISIGLDLATAISIIGGVIIFVWNTSQMNKKTIGEERERERVVRILDIQQEFSHLIKQYVDSFSEKSSEDEMLKNIQNIYHYLRNNAWSSFISLGSKKDLMAVEGLINEMETVAKSINEKNNFNPKGLAQNLILLERSMLVQIRQMMNTESVCYSSSLVESYAKKKYDI